jgi:hypothetical protein
MCIRNLCAFFFKHGSREEDTGTSHSRLLGDRESEYNSHEAMGAPRAGNNSITYVLLRKIIQQFMEECRQILKRSENSKRKYSFHIAYGWTQGIREVKK